MHPIDWLLIAVIPVLVIWDGVRRGSKATDLEGGFQAWRALAGGSVG